jgi:ubiquinone biosynthesis protein COQ9
VFALLATPTVPLGPLSLPLPLLDPRPALAHAAGVADEACLLASDKSNGVRDSIALAEDQACIFTSNGGLFFSSLPQHSQTEWYTRRAVLGAAYAAAELHQLTSPHTARAFLDDLLRQAEGAHRAVEDVGLYGAYIARSWAGIIRSSNVLL